MPTTNTQVPTIDMTRKSNDPRHENILTIFSDLSFCPNSCAAGYGVWMRDKERGQLYGGNFSEPICSTNMGEFYAALYGLHHAVRNRRIVKATYVVFVVDNQRAVELLNNAPPKVAWETLAQEDLRKIMREYKLDWKANKVKAHCGTKTPRNWVNDQVDREAKRYMRKHRIKLGVING